ncbi:MAG: glycosidase, partial [Rhodothermales bacterium]|nr:glycosidase [Rhodothermales bacterium]
MPEIPWASGAVFNPGVWYDGEVVHLLFRAIPEGYRRVANPDPDPQAFPYAFENYVSYVGYARSRDGLNFEVREEPFLRPDQPSDRFGVEDPRLVQIDGTYYVTYTALGAPAFAPGEQSRVRIGLAQTKDFKRVRKHGVVGPPMTDKDAVLFPRRINGRIAMLHRIHPDIQVAWFDSLEQLKSPGKKYWEEYLDDLDEHVVLRPATEWEARKVGAGSPPIETDEGWLLIYHGVSENRTYRAGMALLDLDDPRRVIARTKEPILVPELDFERVGDVDNVVFPTGAALIHDHLHLYYGAADKAIGYAVAPLEDALRRLRAE